MELSEFLYCLLGGFVSGSFLCVISIFFRKTGDVLERF